MWMRRFLWWTSFSWSFTRIIGRHGLQLHNFMFHSHHLLVYRDHFYYMYPVDTFTLANNTFYSHILVIIPQFSRTRILLRRKSFGFVYVHHLLWSVMLYNIFFVAYNCYLKIKKPKRIGHRSGIQTLECRCFRSCASNACPNNHNNNW